MNPLIAAADGAALTLHRCIDVSRNPMETYLCAHHLGFDTVLTSGATASCMEGLDTIRSLLELRDRMNGPEILIGAGVNPDNAQKIISLLPHVRAFHGSCKTMIESAMVFRRDEVPMGLPYFDEWHIQQTDEDQVRALKAAISV